MSLTDDWIDRAKANRNQTDDTNTGTTPFLRPSRKFWANSVRLLTRFPGTPSSGKRLLNRDNRINNSASMGGKISFGVSEKCEHGLGTVYLTYID